MTDARITQDAVKVLGGTNAAARVTQDAVKVLGDSQSPARVTQTAIQLLSQKEPTARLSQAFVKVLHRNRPVRGPSKQVPIAISMTSEKGIPGDPYWSRVEFLLRSDVGYFDLSRRKRQFSIDRRFGPFLTTAQAKFGTRSFHKRASGSGYVRYFGMLTKPDRQALGMGRKPFTIEAWVRVGATNQNCVILSNYNAAGNDRGWMLQLAAGVPTFWAADNTNTSATLNINAGAALPINQWHHVCVDRDKDGKVRLYVNGVVRASADFDVAIRRTNLGLRVGSFFDTANGEFWFDDVRYTNGVCRYGSDTGFTPPTQHPPYEARTIARTDPTQDPYYDLVSVYLNTSAGITDLGPKKVPVYGDPAPLSATSQSQSFYDGPIEVLWHLESNRKIVVPNVDGQNNIGDGSAFTIECIFNYYASQGVVSYDIIGVPGQWVLWASAGNMRIYFVNASGGYVSVGNAGDNSYSSVIHFAFTYDGKGTSRMYMNGYCVDITRGVYPLDKPGAELILGLQSSPGRINEFRLTKGVARWTDDYCIPADEYHFRPALTGPTYVPEEPSEDERFYPYPLAVVNPKGDDPVSGEWLQLSGNVPGRWNKFLQTAGWEDVPDGHYFLHLQTTTRVHTIQTLAIPTQFDADVDAGTVDATFKLDFGQDPRATASEGCYLIRARNALGQVTAQRYSRNFKAEGWSHGETIRLPLPAGTRQVDVGFMAYNSNPAPAINCTHLEAWLEVRAEPVHYVAAPSFPVIPAEWATNLGGAITTQVLDYATTGLAQTADMSDTYFQASLPAAAISDIDAGLCSFTMSWFGSLHSADNNDGGRVWLEFYDASDVRLGERRYDSAAYYTQKLGGEGSSLEVKIPSGARKVRMGYRGVRNPQETGIVSFYPLGINGYVTKPAVLPADPPVAPVVSSDPDWPLVRYLLSSRNGNVENLALWGSVTHTVNGTFRHTATDSKFGDAHNIEVNPTGAAANTDFLDVLLPGAAFKTELTIEAWLLKKGNPRSYAGLFGGLGGIDDGFNTLLQWGGPQVRSDAPIPFNEWFHVAFCRDANGVVEMFLNGKKQTSVNLAYLNALPAAFQIGRVVNTSSYASWYGYIDEFRITDGKRRYTEDFIPQSNRFPASGGPADLLPCMYTGNAVSGSNLASYTHTNHPIGAADANRRVIVAVVNNRATGIDGSPTSVTVGGIAAAKLAEFDSSWHSALHNVHISFWSAAVQTGTTAAVAVAYTGTRYRHAIATWSVNGDFEVIDTVQGSDAQPSLGSLDVGEGGRVLAVALNSQNVGNYLALAEAMVHEDGQLEIGNDYLSWTGVGAITSVNVENDTTGAFNRFVAISLVKPGSYAPG